MAHWGHAMSMLENPFGWPATFTPPRLDSVVAALDAAQAAGLKSKREQDYVAAVGVFVRGHATKPYAERMKAFDAAMASLMATYPDDTEAKVLSALITSANFDPTDKNYANQLKAAAILEPLFKAHPNHPGVAHYLIHSYDYPPIAEKGLTAAKAYAAIAPDAPHALHMPSHIFTRVGYWRESIAANRESARVAGEATFDGAPCLGLHGLCASATSAGCGGADGYGGNPSPCSRSTISAPPSPMPPCRHASRWSAATGPPPPRCR